MTDMKKLVQAMTVIGDVLSIPEDTHNPNAEPLSQRVLFAICDQMAANYAWLSDSGIPNTCRSIQIVERGNKDGEIDLVEKERLEENAKVMTMQMLHADHALEHAKKVYLAMTGRDYVWVPFNERKKAKVRSDTVSAIQETLAKLRAKNGQPAL